MDQAARPSWRALALVFGIGAVAALGQAPWNAWYLSLPAFGVAIWYAIGAADARSAGWIGWAFGAGYFALALGWIIEPFLVDLPRHGWMAPFAISFLAGGLAVLWAAAFWGAMRFAPGLPVPALMVAWTGVEMLRGVLFTGFPWAMPGHIWVDTPVRILAGLGGASGLTLFTFVLAGLPFVWTRRWIGGLASLVLGVIAFGFGALTLGGVQVESTGKTVRLVQPNAPQHQKWDPEMIPTFFDRMVEMTGAEGDPSMIVWPETALAWRLDRAEAALQIMTDSAKGVPVVFGANDFTDGAYRNAMTFLTTEGDLGPVYHKHHLVPFGEYIPYGDLFARVGIRGIAARDGGGFAPGPGPAIVDIPGVGTALPLICYEMIFPRNLWIDTRPDMILHLTNDAWFGDISGPYQHLAQARLRAVEQGLPVLRAANTGVSAAIDPLGRVLGQIPLGETGYLDQALPAPLAQPLYARTGDWPLTILLGVAFLGLVTLGRRKSD